MPRRLVLSSKVLKEVGGSIHRTLKYDRSEHEDKMLSRNVFTHTHLHDAITMKTGISLSTSVGTSNFEYSYSDYRQNPP
jgi:hypothetical protein